MSLLFPSSLRGMRTNRRAVVVGFVFLVALPGVALVGETKLAAADFDRLDKQIAFDLGNGVTLQLVLIPPGHFMMGSRDDDESAHFTEKPAHKVTISKPFYLGKYEVTQQQWQAIMNNNPSNTTGPKNPVDSVNIRDCQAFIAKLNARIDGSSARFFLPTEAQWEYACRAGGTSRYTFGDDEKMLPDYAWFQDNAERVTHPVGQKKPNAWGLYDIHGNVWEWCSDRYGNDYYKNSPEKDPVGAATGNEYLLRGGAMNTPGQFLRSAHRTWNPLRRVFINGFRVARTAEP